MFAPGDEAEHYQCKDSGWESGDSRGAAYRNRFTRPFGSGEGSE